jgi:hypothetical protein
MHVHSTVYINTKIRTSIHRCMYLYVYVHYTNIHVYINTNVHTTSYACVYTALHTYMCAYAYSIVSIQ